ncbi:MAG: TRAP transporter large permease [Synergistaceae bacterium]|jgi:tripartite ATP-independent transporter DctM subunit|nr:TRAP transporter large permease [Synergistaceae bacterium]
MLLLMGSFLLFMALGMPISFCMFSSSAFYLLASDITLVSLVQRVSAGVYSFPLLAAPCFILAGAIMNTSGITDRIFDWCNRMVGHIPGGLGHTNVLASIVFAGMSGTAVADAGGLGQVELKAMKDAGFDEPFSLAITAASSTIGPIIPPSLPAVMVGVIGGVSVGRIFVGGLVPGLLMGACLSVMVYILAVKRGYPREKKATLREVLLASKKAFFSMMTVVIAIGGILAGVFTPTEAGVVALAYATLLGFAYRELTPGKLYGIVVESSGVILSVLFIIASGSIFGWILAIEQVPQSITMWFVSRISSAGMALLVINILLVIAGMFLDSMCSISLLTPILLPVALRYGIDPVHFSIVMILNLMIGLITPPVGVVLYILSSISGVSFDRIVKAVLPFLLALFVALVVVTYVPATVTWLPNLLYNR